MKYLFKNILFEIFLDEQNTYSCKHNYFINFCEKFSFENFCNISVLGI